MKIAAIGKRLLPVTEELTTNGVSVSWHPSVEDTQAHNLVFIEAEPDIQRQLKDLVKEQAEKNYYKKVVLVDFDNIAIPAAMQLPPFIVDVVQYSKNKETFVGIVKTLIHFTSEKKAEKKNVTTFKMPLSKRLFDIIVSSMIILMISPILILVAILIKLESKGPIVYQSPRVGTGYKIFPFYKFRSMRPDADKLLENMKHLNHYAQDDKAVEDPTTKIDGVDQSIAFDDENVLIGDDYWVEEPKFAAFKQKEEKNSFVKINNDPRITRVGKIIRNSSIDELPQLFNVLLGHMSIVGNRPLPLYEAEKLTSDDWSKRFMAPAGITGLWQVTERGKKATSEDSRKRLDIEYAENYSLWMDIKILVKTPLAAFQHENV
ncbi:sugar transferase [uncultured Imperialibacter sp.]|uniref:sugar transferase n=1 Tax=uncultured Imperialibacter sp. TaxID=1672639 RepID=UPI0030D7606D|tara:strand:+ start:1051 stop:2175 length:1125 start_codon:yes stop_codon:yes gene_type:complete